MRTWGRTTDEYGNKTWVEVTTDANGFNDYVYITTLIQTLLLNLGESPFYADRGIPAHQSVIQQVFPDFYMSRTQQQFSQYFASLTLARLPGTTPTYRMDVTTHSGAKVQAVIAK